MENWKEYINYKFQPKEDFVFETIEDSTTLKITHPLSGHSFFFYWLSDDGLSFTDLQFHNDKTEGWSGECGDMYFSPEAIQKVDEFLRPAFETGWKSRDVYLFGRHFKSTVTFSEKRGDKFIYYSGDGCLPLLLWPLYWLLELFYGNTQRVLPISSYYK